MLFEWDDSKNRNNIIKHGIDFETVQRIFDSLVLTGHDQRHDYGEDRRVSIGQVDAAVIVVSHTVRGRRMRLISAQSASRKERRRWDDSIR